MQLARTHRWRQQHQSPTLSSREHGGCPCTGTHGPGRRLPLISGFDGTEYSYMSKMGSRLESKAPPSEGHELFVPSQNRPMPCPNSTKGPTFSGARCICQTYQELASFVLLVWGPRFGNGRYMTPQGPHSARSTSYMPASKPGTGCPYRWWLPVQEGALVAHVLVPGIQRMYAPMSLAAKKGGAPCIVFTMSMHVKWRLKQRRFLIAWCWPAKTEVSWRLVRLTVSRCRAIYPRVLHDGGVGHG